MRVIGIYGKEEVASEFLGTLPKLEASGVRLADGKELYWRTEKQLNEEEDTLFSCPPEVVRPAGDETGVEWRGVAGTEVGLRLGAREPAFQLDRGPFEHPRLCHGRPAGPEHAC